MKIKTTKSTSLNEEEQRHRVSLALRQRYFKLRETSTYLNVDRKSVERR